MSEVDQKAEEMSPLSYLKIFFRRKELLIIPAIIGLVLGICLGIILPPQYKSATVLLIEEGKSDNPLFEDLAVSTSVQQRMNTIQESMLGWNSLVELVKRLKLDINVRTPKEFEELIEKIKEKVEINLRGSNIINLSFTGPDPQQAQAVVKSITDIFIERNVNIQNQETSSAIIFIEEQLKVYRGKIKSSEIAQLNDELKALLYDSTEEHPQVKKLREQIAQKQEELRKENLEYQEVGPQDNTTNTVLIQGIQQALDKLEKTATSATTPAEVSPVPGIPGETSKDALYKVMLIEKLGDVRARDANINQQVYNMLLQRLETAKITQRLQSSKEGTRYTILDPARVPLEPSYPNRILLALAGLIGGVVIGVGLIFGLEFLDKSFLDVEDTKNFLGQPLLGAISKINTEATLRFERERQAWMYSVTIIAGVVFIILIVAIRNFIR